MKEQLRPKSEVRRKQSGWELLREGGQKGGQAS